MQQSIDRQTQFKLILDKQRTFFLEGKTRSLTFRLAQLKKIKSLLMSHQTEIMTALKQDLRRSEAESILMEFYLVRDEIDFIINQLPKWMSPKKSTASFPLSWLGKSIILSEPYGSVLIVAPWNYPLLLCMSPLIGAMSAGNCIVLKPSEIAEHTQRLFIKLINDHFPPDYIIAIPGGPDEVTALLQQRFDYLFFTGSPHIGKIMMAAAANHLTPITLELGGKSPCIVDDSANVPFAANRIIWAKTTNAGQTCIAPDYVLVHRTRKDELVNHMMTTIKQFYGENPAQSDSYCRIINKKHVERLSRLMKEGRILFGGEIDPNDLYIAPTLIDGVSWDDLIMQEEIFGPLLPIITFETITELVTLLQKQPKSLALYAFTNNKMHEEHILHSLSFGGGCINDCMLQFANCRLPFGGVGHSGFGTYHGKYSFETFSHQKSIYKKYFPIKLGIDHPPYTEKKLTWIKRVLKV